MLASKQGRIFVVLVIAGSCLINGCGGNSSNSNSLNSSNPTFGQISGQIVDSLSKAPLPGTFVSLEQRDSQNIERLLRVISTDAQGNFTFQSVSSGTYEVVAYSANFNPSYTWMVIFAVPQNANLGSVPLQGTFLAPEGFPGTAQGMVTASPVAVDTTIWLMSPVSQNGTSLLVTIPFTAAGFVSRSNVVTSAFPYGVSTETFLPTIGIFSVNGVAYTANSGDASLFVIDAQAVQPATTVTPDCVPPELQTAPFGITAGPGVITNVPTLAFAGCK